LTGVAVKVTGEPWQAGLAEALMDTAAGVPVFITIVMAFEIAGFMIAQVMLDVIWHVTKSPCTGA